MQKHKHNAGFTLLEVLIAISVFSIASLGVFALLLTNIRGVMEIENRLIATNLVQGKLDALLDVRNSNWIAGESDFMKDIQTTEKIALCQDNRGFYLEDVSNNPQCRTQTPFSVQVLVGECEDVDGNNRDDVCPVSTRVYWGTIYTELSMRFYDWGGPEAVLAPASSEQEP